MHTSTPGFPLFDLPRINQDIKQRLVKGYMLPCESKILNMLHSSSTAWFKNLLSNLLLEVHYARESRWDYYFYVLETEKYIHRYSQVLRTPVRLSFNQSARQLSSPTSRRIQTDFKSCLARMYTSARFPTRMDALYHNSSSPAEPSKISCTHCSSSTGFVLQDNDIFVNCNHCGFQITLPYNKINHGDSKRVNLLQKNLYDKRNHFLDCINNFQGNQRCIIDPELIERIESHLRQYVNLVDESRTERVEQFRFVEKKHIKLILKELGISKDHYDNINPIYHKITAKPVNDISHLKDKLLKDFDMFNEHFARKYENSGTTEIDKKAFNYQHLLFQLLRRHHYKCNMSDFNFLKTTERKSYHDDMYRVIFEELNWNYVPLF